MSISFSHDDVVRGGHDGLFSGQTPCGVLYSMSLVIRFGERCVMYLEDFLIW